LWIASMSDFLRGVRDRSFIRHGLAVVVVVAAFLLRHVLARHIGSDLHPYLTFYPAVMVVALLSGFWAGLLATALAGLTAAYWILPPVGFAVDSPVDRLGLAVFISVGVLTSVVAGLYHRSQRRAAAYEKELVRRESEKLAEEEIRRSQQLLQAIIDNSQALIYVKDVEGRIIIANQSLGQTVGLKVQEVLGKTSRQIISDPEVGEAHMANDRRVLETGQAITAEESSHGHVFLSVKFPLRDARGRIFATGGISTDITERKRIEEEMARLASFPQLNPNPLIEVDLAGRVHYRNAAAEQLLADLPERGPQHPYLADWAAITRALSNGRPDTILREVTVGARVYQQTVHHLPALGRVRIYAMDVTERRRAANALVESRERLDLALASSRMATFDWDIVQDKRTWDDNLHALLGTKPGSFTGTAQEFYQVIHPEDRAAVQAALTKAVQTTAPYETEYRAVWPDGSIRHIAARGKVHRDPAGRADRMTGICWDITERKRAEESLRESEERYRSLFDNMLDGYAYCRMLYDDQGSPNDFIYLDVNGAFERLSGLADVVGMKVSQVIPGIAQSAPELLQTYGRVAMTGQPERFETYLDSLKIWFSISVYSPARDYFVAVFDNVTARKRSEEELRKLNRTLTAQSRSDQALIRVTEELPYLQAVCRIIVEDCGHAMVWVGYAEQDEGRTVRPVASAGFQEGYLDTLQITWADTERGRGPTGTAIRTGKPSGCRNMLTDPAFAPWRDEAVRRGYGSSLVLPLLVEGRTFGALTIYSRAPEAFSDEEARLLTGLASDLAVGITAIRLRAQRARAEEALRHEQEALRKTAQELERSNKDLEQFAYVSSHDLQEPLRMVTGFMQLLEQKYRGQLDATGEKYIHFAVDGAKRMQQLIDDLLAYSRVGTRAQPPGAAASERAFEAALLNLRIAIQSSEAQVTRGPLPVVRADPGQLVQVFQNLIGNAVKFCGPRPPRVHVEARREDDHWVFSVRDHGIGIEPQYHQRIFEVFQRLHGRTEYPGTGIGLAICQRIVDRHGGRIWVESSLGEGSVFYFTLPA
jgi:PAS domain S-box-containing protein